MKFGKCFLCNKIKLIAYNVTEILPENQVITYVMCENCGKEATKDAFDRGSNVKKKSTQVQDVQEIKTPQDLLSFLFGLAKPQPQTPSKKSDCTCGMSAAEFEKYGRFGCPNCYDHFSEYVEKLVLPYHKAKEHVGKVPRRKLREQAEVPEEKLKLLKLKMAKCIELENYEEASKLKSEIKSLENSLIDAEPPQASLDQ